MSGYRQAPARSPTEDHLYSSGNLTASSYPSSATRSSNYSNGNSGSGKTSVLSSNIIPAGARSGGEGELGPYSALRTRSAASSHSSSGNNAAAAGNGGMIALIGEKEADDYLVSVLSTLQYA